MKYEEPNMQVMLFSKNIICDSQIEHNENPFEDKEEW